MRYRDRRCLSKYARSEFHVDVSSRRKLGASSEFRIFRDATRRAIVRAISSQGFENRIQGSAAPFFSPSFSSVPSRQSAKGHQRRHARNCCSRATAVSDVGPPRTQSSLLRAGHVDVVHATLVRECTTSATSSRLTQTNATVFFFSSLSTSRTSGERDSIERTRALPSKTTEEAFGE